MVRSLAAGEDMNKKLTIGIIPDGNRTYATQFQMPLEQAYRRGADAAFAVVRALLERDIAETLVFFCLSEDNLRLRSVEDIAAINAGVEAFLQQMKALPVAVHFHGCQPGTEDTVQLSSHHTMTSYGTDTRLNVHLLYRYSPEWDLATQPFRTAAIPPLDLVVRTAGRTSLSGFLPVQCAHAELYVSKLFWPAFTVGDLFEIVRAYQAFRKEHPAHGA